MPTRKKTTRSSKPRARRKPSTRAGGFVREEMHHYQEGVHDKKHPIRSPKQAVSIGLSKARRAGVAVPPASKRRPRKSA